MVRREQYGRLERYLRADGRTWEELLADLSFSRLVEATPRHEEALVGV